MSGLEQTKERTRTEYSIRNTSVKTISSILQILAGYIVRIIFTQVFTSKVVGLNGLCTDIISILSLAEMGFESAVIYALYEPIAHGNINKQKSIMLLYRKFYHFVAFAVMATGLVIMIFLPVVVKDYASVENIRLIFFLFLLNAASSYLLIYRSTLITAHQMAYIPTLYWTISLVVQDVLQIILMLIYPDFILFLIVGVIATIVRNVLLSRKAEKMYPYLKDRDVTPLEDEERCELTKNVKAVIFHKVGTVAVNNTDNIIISAFMGLSEVGIYSMYFLVIGSVRQVLDHVFEGLSASVGNFSVTESDEAKRKLFNVVFFLDGWLFGFAGVCVYQLVSPFVGLSFGEEYVFADNVVLILCVNLTVTGLRRACMVFHDAMGLFWYDRFKPVAETVINIVASIILVQIMGTFGVFLGTFIGTMTTNFWIEPYVVYKHGFHSRVSEYFIRYAAYGAVIVVAFIATTRLCSLLPEAGFVLTFIMRLPVAVIVPNIIFFLCFFKTREFGEVWNIAKGFLKKRMTR